MWGENMFENISLAGNQKVKGSTANTIKTRQQTTTDLVSMQD
jgi:hypothetical protein